MTLPELLDPLTISDVISALDNYEVRHISRNKPGHFDSIMSWALAEQVIQLKARDASTLRVYRDGKRIVEQGLKEDWAAIAVNGATVRRLIRERIAIVVSNMDPGTPVLQQLAYDAERHFATSPELAIVATFGQGYALDPHFDAHDILVFQVAGVKNWKILGEERSEMPPGKTKARAPEDVTREICMRPGDLLLLPHGIWHSCWSEGNNLQFTILLKRNRGWDFLRWLVKRIELDPAFGRAAPLARDPAGFAAYERQWKMRLSELVHETALADYLADGDRLVPIPVHLDVDPDIDHAARETIVSLLPRRPIPLPAGTEEPLCMNGLSVPHTPVMLRVVELLNRAVSLSVGSLLDRLSAEQEAEAVIEAIRVLDTAGLVVLRWPPYQGAKVVL